MAKWLVLDEFKGAQGTLAAGDVLDDSNVDVESLRRSGIAVVPTTALVERLSDRARSSARSKGRGLASNDLMALLIAEGVLPTSVGRTHETKELHLSPSGSDTKGTGSAGNPLKTIVEAYRQLPKFVEHPVILRLAAGTYDWPAIKSIFYDAVYLRGNEQTDLVPRTAAASGSTQFQVVTSGLNANDFRGRTIEILTGAAAGDQRTIRDHDATTIVPCARFSAAVGEGDEFRIYESPITLNNVDPVKTLGAMPLLPRQRFVLDDQVRAHLGVINCNVDLSGERLVWCRGAPVHFYGVRFIGNSLRLAGNAAFGFDVSRSNPMKSLEGRDVFGAPNEHSWGGWGVHVDDAQTGASELSNGIIGGSIVAARLNISDMAVAELNGNVWNEGIHAFLQSFIRFSGSAFDGPRSLINSTGAFAFRVNGKSLGALSWVDLTGATDGVVCENGSYLEILSAGNQTNITATAGIGLFAKLGGRIAFSANGTFSVTAGTNETEVEDAEGANPTRTIALYDAVGKYIAAGPSSIMRTG